MYQVARYLAVGVLLAFLCACGKQEEAPKTAEQLRESIASVEKMIATAKTSGAGGIEELEGFRASLQAQLADAEKSGR
jgi:hypothetical protein